MSSGPAVMLRRRLTVALLLCTLGSEAFARGDNYIRQSPCIVDAGSPGCPAVTGQPKTEPADRSRRTRR